MLTADVMYTPRVSTRCVPKPQRAEVTNSSRRRSLLRSPSTFGIRRHAAIIGFVLSSATDMKMLATPFVTAVVPSENDPLGRRLEVMMVLPYRFIRKSCSRDHP